MTTSESEVLAVLEDVDSGAMPVKLTSTDEVHVEYETASGWRLRVFEDVGDWDYLDAYAPPGGEWIGVEVGNPLLDWRPANLARWHWVTDGISPNGYAV